MGKLISCGKTKLTVAAGKEIHVELAEKAVIHVALSDPKLMVVGAKVTIHGEAAETKKIRWCEPDEITVTLVAPLTGKEKPSQSAAPERAAVPKESTTPKDNGMFGFLKTDSSPAASRGAALLAGVHPGLHSRGFMWGAQSNFSGVI